MSDCEISKIITNYNPEGKREASRAQSKID